MEAKGYNYSEVTVDGQVIGTWSKSTQPSTQPTVSTEVKDVEQSKEIKSTDEKMSLNDLIGYKFEADYGLIKGIFILEKVGVSDIKHGNRVYEREYIILRNIKDNKVERFYGSFKNNSFYVTETSDKKRVSTASTIQFNLIRQEISPKVQEEKTDITNKDIDNLPPCG
jgi:hypothetical protein